ncbi:hypothetical protein HDV01_006035 [Terramyces sp. JEL0728]|nr:hypothetical protein HDV01_006035 [Terramyces sp. JEL0728]
MVEQPHLNNFYKYNNRTIKVLKINSDLAYCRFLDGDKREDIWISTKLLAHNETETEQETAKEIEVRTIEYLYFQGYKISTWYYSPFPNSTNSIYLCKHCLKYNNYYTSHEQNCAFRLPQNVVYEKDNLKIIALDGKETKLYCQNLCLMTKLFLDHKTIFYDLDPFLFYVLFENDTLVGYFSKEKYSVEGYNLSCILVLPPYQNKRYGRLLIEFSYELCKLKKVIGGPERPLSDLGFKGYLSYWKTVILSILGLNPTTTFTLGELSVLTSINQSDILLVLSACELLDHWKDGNVCIEMEKIKVEEKMSIDSSCIIITRNFY